MTRVAVAAPSQIAADGGASVAPRGGNAVDAAIAASIVSMCTDPGIIALGGGGYLTIATPDGDEVVIDAYVEMPGRTAPPERLGTGARAVHLDYGGGVTTMVGHGTVATPGSVAGLGLASDRFGTCEWPDLVAPARRWARDGFPLSGAAAEYLTYSHELIFGWHPESRRSFNHPDGTPLGVGETVHLPGLHESLGILASEGPDALYTGTLGRRMAEDNQANGGLLAPEDLAAYEPIERTPLAVELDRATLLTNPGPAIGGAAVAAFLALLRDVPGWEAKDVARIAGALAAVLTFRREHLDGVREREPAVDRLMTLAALGDPARLLSSPSTIHVSAVDDDGLACAISMSSGYGSGVVVPGSGIWLNNSLGETDLLRTELHSQGPGTRLPSNMAPSIVRRDDGAVLAIGSPGASRITSAVAQVVFNHANLGLPLREAVAHPRLHVEDFAGRPTLAHEPGIDTSEVEGLTPRPFDATSMYFGGTQVAMSDPARGLDAIADPRRTGGVAISE